ncbi:unnamed protein product [Caenorhabditis angaria]|uniref:Apple domain-containing protein n=1 Tax=Caenorhabditis angaria TaxID=860376 RepID=A0A9P1IG12_9PELO|nr:unnamed protein product [Caenorhabditis angaria]
MRKRSRLLLTLILRCKEESTWQNWIMRLGNLIMRKNILILLVLLVKLSENTNLIEDITQDSEEEEEEEVFDDAEEDHQTFPTPPPIGTTRRSPQEKFQIFNEKDIVLGDQKTSGSYALKKQPANRSNKARDMIGNSQDQIIAGIPDLNDPCFRRYENSIIVNAQPYERRSSTGLIHCKSHCLSSQSGVYSCKSFVYDNVNMICDLFAHVGDQAPARLLKFQTRDYFEPTYAVHCAEFGAPPSPPPSDDQIDEHAVALATQTATQSATKTTQIEELIPQKDPEEQDCLDGKISAFLRTEGFELFKNDDEVMENVGDVEECAEACRNNLINNHPLKCKSFDYIPSISTCYFTKEAAVPVGNGQLKQKESAAYHEKICVSSTKSACSGDSDFAGARKSSKSFFSRHPQMILVGFAESVIDASNFETCFDSCLNSFELYGFNCTSGMFYFEEAQLNCILNSENRKTQAELFTEENTDIVDYFEVECETSKRMAGVRNLETSAIQSDKMELGFSSSSRSSSSSEDENNGSHWESWSDCQDGKQTRRKSCQNFNAIEDCAEEVRDCPLSPQTSGGLRLSIKPSESKSKAPTKSEIAAVKRKIRQEGFKCPLNQCCPVFSTCSYGLRHNSHTKQLEWCKRPCGIGNMKKRARLV